MTIRSKEELIDKVAQDHAWRIREISELKNLIETPSTSPTKKRVLCRSGVALLYAHWEGFIKKSGTYFLEYIASQRLAIEELRSNFVTIVLKNRLDQASESKKGGGKFLTARVLDSPKRLQSTELHSGPTYPLPVKNYHYPKKYSAFDEITAYLLRNQKTRARLPFRNIIDTKSNLSTTVLKEISWCLGLEYNLVTIQVQDIVRW